MNNFKSDRIEQLKVHFYQMIGSLEILKNIVISDNELEIFEKSLSLCQSEPDAAAFILGATRRFKLMLKDNAYAVPDDVGAHSQSTVEIEPFVESSHENHTVNSKAIPGVNVNDDQVLIENQATVEISQNENETTMFPCVEACIASSSGVVIQQDDMPLTNTLLMNRSGISDLKFTTIREKVSVFVQYGKIDEIDIGCVFSLKRADKYSRYECKQCRKIVDRLKKNPGELILDHNKPAALTLFNNELHEFKKETHHELCRVEKLPESFARSIKNEAVQFKSRYGGTSKQVYDSHVKILTSNEKKIAISAEDIASGYKTFEKAKSALKKSGQRKSASRMAIIEENGYINRESTIISKTISTEEQDFFLIGQNLETGTIVLGTRFLIHHFFTSAKVLSDGTFKIAPKGYSQCYVLWFIIDGKIIGENAYRSKAIPAVYFLLKGKNSHLYQEAFQILEEYRVVKKIHSPPWKEFLMDNEIAVEKVILDMYPNTKISLCLFHINKNMVKCLIDHKLSEFIRKCRAEAELWFYGKMKQILVLALLPQREIKPAFQKLKKLF